MGFCAGCYEGERRKFYWFGTYLWMMEMKIWKISRVWSRVIVVAEVILRLTGFTGSFTRPGAPLPPSPIAKLDTRVKDPVNPIDAYEIDSKRLKSETSRGIYPTVEVDMRHIQYQGETLPPFPLPPGFSVSPGIR